MQKLVHVYEQAVRNDGNGNVSVIIPSYNYSGVVSGAIESVLKQSRQVLEIIVVVIMEHYFERVFQGKKRILFLMTADHGQIDVNPKTTIYLNTDRGFQGLERFIKTGHHGQLLIPAGSARDMFLHVKDDLLEEAQSFLTRGWKGRLM